MCVCVCGGGRCDLIDFKSGLGHPECNYFGAEVPEMILLSPLGPFEPSDSGRPSFTSKQ